MSHPAPASVVLPREIADAITAQARAESPNEACGLIIGSAAAGDGGIALRYEPCRNAAASPVRYTVHPDDLYRHAVGADDAGEVFWGIVHSHVRSPAVPSRTDIGLAFYPDAVFVIVSLAVERAPSLRGWRILDGVVHEVALEVA